MHGLWSGLYDPLLHATRQQQGVSRMLVHITAKQRFLVGTALAGAGIFLGASPALADCLPDAAGTTIVCNTTDPDGIQVPTNSVTIRVEPAATVGTGAATPSPLL